MERWKLRVAGYKLPVSGCMGETAQRQGSKSELKRAGYGLQGAAHFIVEVILGDRCSRLMF